MFKSRSFIVHRYSTSYHYRFVSVPEFLHAEKKHPLIYYYRKQTIHGNTLVMEKPSREIKLLKSFPLNNLLSPKLLPSL